jgi:alpha-1,3-glucan synthase
LAKFASVQDRLREWQPSVMAKIQVYSCLAMEALDIDAIRVDKSIQVTVDAITAWSVHTRGCAVTLGKKNFLITGEVTGGDTFGSLYLGRGRTPTQRTTSVPIAANLTSAASQYFLRNTSENALDAIAFHYSIYRYLTRFLGMDGNLEAGYDLQPNFVIAWDQMFVDNDFINPNTGQIDPRHMFGVSNFDVFRWPSVINGTLRQSIASFITTIMMPGMPLVCIKISFIRVCISVPSVDFLRRGARLLCLRQRCLKLPIWVTQYVSQALAFTDDFRTVVNQCQVVSGGRDMVVTSSVLRNIST